ncbi:GTP-binding protein [Luteimicrobium subarcticum]|uniref:50S ribosome-binding GTPase n=1 Tax=Luteimicrobium subarcticum TaxID=620910 RepID=A0A2M8WUG8_9MICO|nr:GTP-binding protein [Luteimicrobium subarcticum]PJI94506.1 50S ribosome-binding GTPase [Luteimicrobium subarcticum]
MTDDARLRDRTDDLENALRIARERTDAVVVADVEAAVGSVRERLALGVDHTVVALAGGTGSGKSSLFNAVSRLTFADVGVRRPTTAEVTACSWSDAADALLDWVGVARERRITRESLLDGDDEQGLHGLVLLDLPDHDSIEPAHREVVDRVLPLVDLLVWVVDPQKYADDALHSGYLRASVGMEAAMVVAVNQVDTVPEGRRSSLLDDVVRLVADDGLVGVPVLAVSARTGEGVAELREVLEQAVARRSVAAGRAAAELDRAGRVLLEQAPAGAPWDADAALDREVDALSQAVGLGSVAEQVQAAIRRGYGRPEFGEIQTAAVATSRGRWLSRAGKGLRPGWESALEGGLATPAELVAASRRELETIPLDTRGPSSARPMRRTALVLLVLAVLAAVVALLGASGVLSMVESWVGGLAVGAVAALLVALVLFLVNVQSRRTLARRRRDGVLGSGRAALERVVRAGLADPTRRILGQRDEVRRLAERAREVTDEPPLTAPHGHPVVASTQLPSTA